MLVVKGKLIGDYLGRGIGEVSHLGSSHIYDANSKSKGSYGKYDDANLQKSNADIV